VGFFEQSGLGCQLVVYQHAAVLPDFDPMDFIVQKLVRFFQLPYEFANLFY
jgi:hypothetical protein